MNLDTYSITVVNARQKDDIGEVFLYNNKIYRGIFHEKTDFIKDLINSHLFNILVSKKLIPKTTISDFINEKYGLILEHETLSPVSYCHEWTFDMLKDASLLVLKIAKISREHGYNLKDCHSLNIIFNGSSPVFIDIGSFIKSSNTCNVFFAYTEFLRAYIYPLKMWSRGNVNLAKSVIHHGSLISQVEFYCYNSFLLSLFNLRYLDLLSKLFNLPFLIPKRFLNFNNKNKSFFISIKIYIKKIVDSFFLKTSFDLHLLRIIVYLIKNKKYFSLWGNYHNRIEKKETRFKIIEENIILYCKNIDTVLDVAGNQGLFSILLKDKLVANKFTVQDLDHIALNALYLNLKSKNCNKINIANFDIMSPICKYGFRGPEVRYKSDLVVCLALVHHLVLTQRYTFESIFQNLINYTKKYLVIEFMPKGLWTYGSVSSVPNSYNEEKFSKAMQKFYKILYRKKISDNYILFIGGRLDSE